ncbi:hypothetical protein QCA50_007940 [Cerrena zonata]|uniref:Uncharacterized protein n=1 Tax=Cerrena zonata TaxID=2478898 RepID=A0AAW0GC62_9APHY
MFKKLAVTPHAFQDIPGVLLNWGSAIPIDTMHCVEYRHPSYPAYLDTVIVSRQNGSYRPLGTCLPQSTSAANGSACFYFFFREEILLNVWTS